MRRRVILNIDEKYDHKLSAMENRYGLDKGQIVEIALKRSITEIENSLKELIPIDVQEKITKNEDAQKEGTLVNQEEDFTWDNEDTLKNPMSVGVKTSDFNVSSWEPMTIELQLSNTDVNSKHLTIPTRYLNLFPSKLPNCRGDHYKERDKMFTLIDGNYEYETHIEGANRLPHITGIFHKHPELQPKDRVYIDIIEPKRLYRFRTE
ncbi:hypothetical protein [Methanosarcina sp. 2.H.A.1B.4]|uniref:hypothetical protein n=1 Tax=Methanosarcina sp. 2.H.A.1B.4 TaxID=1483600 RepID=UPI000621F618|nr:hypothetical protein [Methanosarcina sp. 2.H.A.1B.4]KKG10289.1 hypothetical protein EO92_03635 [Methanosarcina sp. 2.H.A.1B.4]